MRLPHPAQRFVASDGAPPKVPLAVSTWVSSTQYSASWPRGSSTEGCGTHNCIWLGPSPG
eukprot:286695-Pyramimonas_sp.AAC.1